MIQYILDKTPAQKNPAISTSLSKRPRSINEIEKNKRDF
jgi:hypothetical protein